MNFELLLVSKNDIYFVMDTSDIANKFAGLHHRDKLCEELFADSEEQVSTQNPKICIARVADADYDRALPK